MIRSVRPDETLKLLRKSCLTHHSRLCVSGGLWARRTHCRFSVPADFMLYIRIDWSIDKKLFVSLNRNSSTHSKNSATFFPIHHRFDERKSLCNQMWLTAIENRVCSEHCQLTNRRTRREPHCSRRPLTWLTHEFNRIYNRNKLK